MSTKVMPMGLPPKSSRKIKKVLEEELANYELELHTQQDIEEQSQDITTEKQDVSCTSDNQEWIDVLLEFAENRFEAEDEEKVDVVNVEGYNGMSSWELAVPNPRLVSKVRRAKPTSSAADVHATDTHETRSKEFEFVDAPAWRICVDPSTYSYVPNNGRYRASKLMKRTTDKRYSRKLLCPQDSRVTPERQHLQREIQREFSKEFEMYVKQQDEKDHHRAEDEDSENPTAAAGGGGGGGGTASMMNTYRSKADDATDMDESDVERFEAEEWMESKTRKDSKKRGNIALIAEPASVLKVSNNNGIAHQSTKRGKTNVLPPLDFAGNPLNGDQFLEEVSSRLLNWEKERNVQVKTGVNQHTEIEKSQTVSSREQRSKSEPPTISELIDIHQNRTGYFHDLTVTDNPSSNYGSIHMNVLGSNTSIKDKEHVRYRLPKQRTDSSSMQEHKTRQLSQNSAPIERHSGRNRSEQVWIAQPSEHLIKLPPRGESLPIRTPLKALQPAPKKTAETVSDRTFSVRQIPSLSNFPDMPLESTELAESSEMWDHDDRAIEEVLKRQQLVMVNKISRDTSPSHQSNTSSYKAVTAARTHPTIQASRVITIASPLHAMAVVNHRKYTPEIAVPKAPKTEEVHPHEHTYETPERENTPTGNSQDAHSDIMLQGNTLQMVVTSTKMNNNASMPRKTVAKGKNNVAHKSRSLTPDRSRVEKFKNADGTQLHLEEMVIGVSGKKIGYNETTHRII